MVLVEGRPIDLALGIGEFGTRLELRLTEALAIGLNGRRPLALVLTVDVGLDDGGVRFARTMCHIAADTVDDHMVIILTVINRSN